jgi:hypothetical protein
LYKLQISVAQEIHSRARSDAKNLEIVPEENITLKEVINQEGHEKKIAQKKVEDMEKYIGAVFRTIPNNVESDEVSSEEKMRKLVQAFE